MTNRIQRILLTPVCDGDGGETVRHEVNVEGGITEMDKGRVTLKAATSGSLFPGCSTCLSASLLLITRQQNPSQHHYTGKRNGGGGLECACVWVTSQRRSLTVHIDKCCQVHPSPFNGSKVGDKKPHSQNTHFYLDL